MNKDFFNFALIFLLLISKISYSIDANKQAIGKPLQYNLKFSRLFWEHAREGKFNEMVDLLLNNGNLVCVNFLNNNSYPESVTAYDFATIHNNFNAASYLSSFFGAYVGPSKYPFFIFIEKIIKEEIPTELPINFEKYINFVWQGLTALDWTLLFSNEKMARFILSLKVNARTCLFDEHDFAERFPVLWDEITNMPQQFQLASPNEHETLRTNHLSIEIKYAKLKKQYKKQKELTDKQFVARNDQFQQNYCCIICFDEENFVSLPCGHVFGKICATKLKDCAKCKKPFSQRRLRNIFF